MSLPIRVACVSDTHNLHEELTLPQADILVVAGDFCGQGTVNEVSNFNQWLDFARHDYEEILVVPGNHDWAIQRERACLPHFVRVLVDQEFVYKNVKFYGTPWCTEFGHWAYQLPPKQLQEKYDLIPHDTDVLISHMPAYGTLDLVERPGGFNHVGSKELADKIKSLPNLKAHIFGHLHLCGGQVGMSQNHPRALAVNAAVVDEHYQLVNPPMVISIEKIDIK